MTGPLRLVGGILLYSNIYKIAHEKMVTIVMMGLIMLITVIIITT